MQTYIDTTRYHAALDALEKIAREHDDAAPEMLRTLLIEAVGDQLGIWPASCEGASN